jgi:hypothetical protein
MFCYALVETTPTYLHRVFGKRQSNTAKMNITQCNIKQDLEKLTLEQLRKLLVARGKPYRGIKAELMTRLWPVIQAERIIAGPLGDVSSVH